MPQRYAHLSDAGLKKATAGVATMLDRAAAVPPYPGCIQYVFESQSRVRQSPENVQVTQESQRRPLCPRKAKRRRTDAPPLWR